MVVDLRLKKTGSAVIKTSEPIELPGIKNLKSCSYGARYNLSSCYPDSKMKDYKIKDNQHHIIARLKIVKSTL